MTGRQERAARIGIALSYPAAIIFGIWAIDRHAASGAFITNGYPYSSGFASGPPIAAQVTLSIIFALIAVGGTLTFRYLDRTQTCGACRKRIAATATVCRFCHSPTALAPPATGAPALGDVPTGVDALIVQRRPRPTPGPHAARVQRSRQL